MIEQNIYTYKELLRACSQISRQYHGKQILYRGQSQDYGRLQPSMFRVLGPSNPRLNNAIFDKRMETLKEKEKAIRDVGPVPSCFSFGPPIVLWSIIQHYGIAETPLLDLTSSLNIALSFALIGPTKSPVVYVLALPASSFAISTFYEEKVEMVDLRKICPPEADRPHFQEALFVTHYPLFLDRTYSTSPASRAPERMIDFADFVVAKFLIPDDKNWRNGLQFYPTPPNILYPDEDDVVFSELCKLKEAGIL